VSERILLVEDDEPLGRQIVRHLEKENLQVTWVKDGDAALLEASSSYDLIVLDLMLPGTYGMDVLKHVRESMEVPVLILSARVDTTDKVRALRLGADDYVTKPFWPEELVARVLARLRRPSLRRSDRVTVGALTLDRSRQVVEAAGKPVALTRVEFDLLDALARRPGIAVTREWLADHVLDPDQHGTERTLDVHISRLRKKLGPCSKQVRTVWRIGYCLDPEPVQ
jgi:two-component system response regulator MtrA